MECLSLKSFHPRLKDPLCWAEEYRQFGHSKIPKNTFRSMEDSTIGSVATFGPGDKGSNPGWSAVNKFKFTFG